jgi:membrane protein insertase Oxa1/YidC/SpoIIIJ
VSCARPLKQETMKLLNKAGVNLLAGCIPALIQMHLCMHHFNFSHPLLSYTKAPPFGAVLIDHLTNNQDCPFIFHFTEIY